MAKRKPRSRKAAPARAAGRRIGPLWWGAGLLALGWIAFDANRPAVERHLPQLASVRLPWEEAPTARPARREAAPAPSAAAARPDPVRRLIDASATTPSPPARPAERRQAALAAPAPAPAPRSAPAEARAAAATFVRPAPIAAGPKPAAPAAAAGGLVTRAPLPLRRAPEAGAPVWMVLDPGRPLRVTARQGAFARIESGIFTGWVDAGALGPEPAARPAPRSTMPILAAERGRAGPVPAASVPAVRP